MMKLSERLFVFFINKRGNKFKFMRFIRKLRQINIQKVKNNVNRCFVLNIHCPILEK